MIDKTIAIEREALAALNPWGGPRDLPFGRPRRRSPADLSHLRRGPIGDHRQDRAVIRRDLQPRRRVARFDHGASPGSARGS